jgi:hypothetical protein
MRQLGGAGAVAAGGHPGGAAAGGDGGGASQGACTGCTAWYSLVQVVQLGTAWYRLYSLVQQGLCTGLYSDV